MAKKSVVARQHKREHLVAKYAERRKELKIRVSDESLTYEERWEAMMALQKLPRDSSYARLRNRCALTGRPRGYYRKFGLGRNKLRDVVMRGDAPGVVKASW